MSVHGLLARGLVVLVGLLMVGEGAVKLLAFESQVEGFREFGYPQWFRVVVGGLEGLGGLALLAGFLAGERLVFLAGGAVVGVVLLGAVATHLRVGDPLLEATPAALLFVVMIALLVFQPVGT